MKWELVVIAAAIGTGWWFAPELAKRVRELQDAVAPAPVVGSCPRPTEFEQVHVIVTLRPDGTLGAECMHVGARGAYRRQP